MNLAGDTTLLLYMVCTFGAAEYVVKRKSQSNSTKDVNVRMTMEVKKFLNFDFSACCSINRVIRVKDSMQDSPFWTDFSELNVNIFN